MDLNKRFNLGINIIPERDIDGNPYSASTLFKKKGVHSYKGTGAKTLIAANGTGTISYTCSTGMKYDFSGIEILGGELGDEFQLKVIDVLGQYGQSPMGMLDQFGINWNARPNFVKEMPYASTLMQDMRVDVIFTNNSASAKTIYVNFDLYKVTMA